MKGIGDLLKQAQQMQERLKNVQEELARLEVSGESGAGLVTVTLNGRYEALRLKFDPSLKDESQDVLEDLIAAAFNDAVRKVERAQQEHMAGITGGVNLPPGFKLPF
jgi:nucleoid-associated protein EbfC